MTTHALASVAGYRLLEVIGVGESASVYLAEPADVSAEASARSPGCVPESEPVVVKVCHRPAPDARVTECEVLLDHPVAGMPRLLDATRLPTGEQVIVMTFCPGRPLRTWAAEGAGYPLPRSWAGALERIVGDLHEAGAAHGGIDASSVLVDRGGGVSLLGFGAARRRGEKGFERARATDLSAVRRLAGDVSVAAPRLPTPEEMARPTREHEFDQHFDEAVWAWRERDPEPIVAPEQSVAAVLEPAYLALVEGSRGIKTLAAGSARRLLRSRRRRLLAGAAVAIVGLAGVLCATVPAQDAVAVAGGRPSASVVPASPVAGTPSVAAPPSVVAPPSSAGPTRDDVSVLGDDPVAATTALLRERGTCRRSGEPGCWERVDEWNSPALRLDRQGNEGPGSDGPGATDESGSEVGTPVLVQRIGATAILTIGTEPGAVEAGTTKPASLLVVRGEAGWRIRSYDPF